MPVDEAALQRRFQPGGSIFNAVEQVAARLHAAESRANPVDTGRSRSGWRTRFRVGRNWVTFEVYNDVRYVSFIRRRGTNEERGAFICEAASQVFRQAGIDYECRI